MDDWSQGTHARRLRFAARAAGAAAMLAAALSLLGHLLGQATLAAFAPGQKPMTPFTGYVGLAAGLALVLDEVGPWRRRVARALAWLALGLTALALLGLALGWERLGPSLAGRDALAGEHLLSLPPTPTVLGLFAVTLGLVLDRVHLGRVRLAAALALGALALALADGLAHLYSAPYLIELPGGPSTGGSIPALVIVGALALGDLFARPGEGLVAILAHPAMGGVTARRFLPWVLLGPPAIGLLVLWALQAGLENPRTALALLAESGMALGLMLLFLQANSLNQAEQRRQRAMEELELWRHLFEHAEWGVAVVRPDNTFRLANPAFARMHGTTAEALQGQPVATVYSPAARADLPEHIRLIRERGHHRFVSEHQRADGSVFPVAVDATAVFDAQGRYLYRAVYVQDITEQARAQADQARLAALVGAAEDAIAAVAPDGTVIAWNAGAERLYGFKAEEVVGHDLVEQVVPPERRAQARDTLAATLRGERVPTYDIVGLRKDGSRLHASLTASPIRDEQGRVSAISLIARDISRRLAAEQALRQSEESYRTLVELAGDGIFVADLQGRYVDVNSAGLRLLGLRREEVVGKTIVDLIPPEELPQLTQAREVLSQGRVHVADWHLRHRDGRYLPVEVSARILPDGRWLGFVRDISLRRAAEEALGRAREVERRLAAQLEAVERAAGAISEAVANLPHSDLEAVLRTIVLQAQALTGATYAALGVGEDPERPFGPWVHSGMPEEVVAMLGRPPRPVGLLGLVARQGHSIRLRDLKQHPAFRGFPPGHPAMGSFLGVPIRFRGQSVGNLYLADKQGAPEFTEEDQRAIELLAARAGAALEAALSYWTESQTKTWLQQVIGQMPEGVLVTDSDGRLITCNPRAHALLPGCDEAPGVRPRLDIRRPDGEPLAWEETPLGQTLERQVAAEAQEVVLHGRDGREVPVLMSAAPLRAGTGASPGAICVLRDITALKELERLREEWTAVVAHDLRQPITVIAASATMLPRAHGGPMGPVEAKAVERIGTAARRLNRMIADLLDASRIEARRLRLDLTRVEPELLVRQVLDGLEGSLGGQELRLEVAGPCPAVWADPARLEQVLINLLTNAHKYGSPRAPIVLGLEARPGEVEFRVTNQGPGLSQEELAQLFRRFSRARSAERSQVEGLGLGLYITRGLVEAHGGRIWAESTPGWLTTFRFTLPEAGPPGEGAAAPA